MGLTKLPYPGGSKERVNRAGNAVRDGKATNDDYEVIDIWRAGHRSVLNTFQSILRNRTRGTRIVVAQRHKRRKTIFDKLTRFPSMQLARMDDVAGCRLIFDSITELTSFRSQMHSANFNHKRKNTPEKYDYIARPKATGYRGIHDVYEYDVKSQVGEKYKGLLIESQYRTRFQHAWATCVEVVGFITESQPKFERGDTRYQRILLLASEIIARNYERMRGACADIDDVDVVREFLDLDKELHFMQMLSGLNAADQEISNKKNMILVISERPEDLQVLGYRDATDALRSLFELEKNNPGKDIVLVRADTTEEMRISFRNYFSDARDFIGYIEEGCTTLSGRALGSRRRGSRPASPPRIRKGR